MHAYEKWIIWGNDNYLIQSALVDLVLGPTTSGDEVREWCEWVGTKWVTRAPLIQTILRSTWIRKSSAVRE
jgi:hypothetical protein